MARTDANEQSLEASKLQAIGNLIAASQRLFEYAKTLSHNTKAMSAILLLSTQSQMLFHADHLNALAGKLLERRGFHPDTKI